MSALSRAAIELWWQSLAAATDDMWSAKLKIFTNYPFPDKFANTWFKWHTYLWTEAMKERFWPLLSQWSEERSDCVPALNAAADLRVTFWNSFSAAGPDPDFPCPPHSLLPGLYRFSSEVLAKDPCSQPAVLCRPQRVTSRLSSLRVAQQTESS